MEIERKSIIDMDLILKLPENELEDLINKIQNQIKTKEENRIREVITEHTYLVGKCFKVRIKPYCKMFPEMWRYYKIISARANNEHCVSALRFDEYPTYWFEYHSSKNGYIGNYYFGYYDFDGITIEEGPFYYNNFEEISLEEYNTAMILYINRLQKMEWPADHYRYGNKKPGDPDWEAPQIIYHI